MNEVKMCPLCPNIQIEKLKELITSYDNAAKFEIRCVQMCGICQKKAFIILNGIPLLADNEEILLEKLKEKLK